jgi:16S rRNA (uracil1498-N3)-methyltransferase
MIRFFASQTDISNDTIRLSAEDSDHIRALRLRPDELFIVCDGEGLDHICRLVTRGGGGNRTGDGSHPESGSIAEIVETRPSRGEPTVECSVYIALAKGDRLEYAVQKSVELGAYDIVLFPSERCVSPPGDITKKITRLQKIALETAKQCGRGRIPEITSADSFEAAVRQAVSAALPLFFYECEDKLHLKQALGRYTGAGPVSIVTGPEGGFEPHEAEFARSAGMLAVTLGPRILRCETAPAAVLAAVMYHTGNL